MGRNSKQDKNLRTGKPTKPQGLSAAASAEWDRLIDELGKAGIGLTVAHRAPLALAATIAEDIADARTAIKKDGAYIEGKAGLVAHPAVKRLDALRRDYIKVLTMLGLRSVGTSEDDDKEATLADLLKGKPK